MTTRPQTFWMMQMSWGNLLPSTGAFTRAECWESYRNILSSTTMNLAMAKAFAKKRGQKPVKVICRLA